MVPCGRREESSRLSSHRSASHRSTLSQPGHCQDRKELDLAWRESERHPAGSVPGCGQGMPRGPGLRPWRMSGPHQTSFNGSLGSDSSAQGPGPTRLEEPLAATLLLFYNFQTCRRTTVLCTQPWGEHMHLPFATDIPQAGWLCTQIGGSDTFTCMYICEPPFAKPLPPRPTQEALPGSESRIQ